MAKIYTKGGDKGQTSLYGGTRISKANPKVEAYGAVDEANASIGLAAVHIGNDAVRDLLRLCQKKLVVMGAELAADQKGKRMLKETITEADVKALESAIDVFQDALPNNKEFVVPGLSEASAYLHMARAVVRRAERRIIAARVNVQSNPQIVIYMNRLSDLLFVLSRSVDELDVFKA